MKGRLLMVAAMLASTLAVSPSRPSAPAQADSIVERMVEQNPSLSSYRARVHVDLRMLNFPYLAPKLDGTTYFKRPDNYEVVFDRVPFYAKGFTKIFSDVGDPAAWQHDDNITFQGTSDVDGRPLYVLYMTKKIHSDILDHAVAYIDPKTYELVQMEWHYTSGGSIVLKQSYRSSGAYNVIAAQHVEVDIPHIRAIGNSVYGTYQTNVAVDDSVFTRKP
jgi:outer membrane lipoprotein-sorting protein